ncbi:hypothetical protein A2Z33_00610 [Candidatus Gottesmanbacteria bacterium RBG_16_52_11]|uniref:Transglycosylase SLT domain-containing protein n=1 Tax=Candidatus Gottesmanbacteria bacterium RBG_16_52_11 TaxID=1798374 RepID=A0A1F5YNB1_9BACT|nr:MAG: hypothetical protein A2Z33_00610 [Candidatus Gottesmanbacteria bacterium RBG_16_52_11]
MRRVIPVIIFLLSMSLLLPGILHAAEEEKLPFCDELKVEDIVVKYDTMYTEEEYIIEDVPTGNTGIGAIDDILNTIRNIIIKGYAEISNNVYPEGNIEENTILSPMSLYYKNLTDTYFKIYYTKDKTIESKTVCDDKFQNNGRLCVYDENGSIIAQITATSPFITTDGNPINICELQQASKDLASNFAFGEKPQTCIDRPTGKRMYDYRTLQNIVVNLEEPPPCAEKLNPSETPVDSKASVDVNHFEFEAGILGYWKGVILNIFKFIMHQDLSSVCEIPGIKCVDFKFRYVGGVVQPRFKVAGRDLSGEVTKNAALVNSAQPLPKNDAKTEGDFGKSMTPRVVGKFDTRQNARTDKFVKQPLNLFGMVRNVKANGYMEGNFLNTAVGIQCSVTPFVVHKDYIMPRYPIGYSDDDDPNADNITYEKRCEFEEVGVVGSKYTSDWSIGNYPGDIIDPGTVTGDMCAENPGFTGNNAAKFYDALNSAASEIGIPACVLNGVALIEGGARYNEIPDLAQCLAHVNVCSAVGPMQFTTGKGPPSDPTCSTCPAGYCPNAWAGYGAGGNPCMYKDALSAAARKLKNDGPLTDSDPSSQYQQIRNAGYHYYGNDTDRFARLCGCTYGEYIYKVCVPSYQCGSGNPQALNGSGQNRNGLTQR